MCMNILREQIEMVLVISIEKINYFFKCNKLFIYIVYMYINSILVSNIFFFSSWTTPLGP